MFADMSGFSVMTDEILSIIEQTGSLDSTDQPLRVFFTCYQVLALENDARACSLNSGNSLLLEILTFFIRPPG